MNARTDNTNPMDKQTAMPLDSEMHGVKAGFMNESLMYEVSFPYNPALVREMHGIEGTKFDKEAEVWTVPLDQYDALATALDRMRKEMGRAEVDKADILERAEDTAVRRMQDRGVKFGPGVKPQIGDFKNFERGTTGEVINVNARYAAQLTGFGDENGAAFVTIHRLSDLDRNVFKGDTVAIQYDKATGKATVEERGKSASIKMDESMGQLVDGVRVVEVEGKYHVSFDYNPALQQRIKRVDGAEFSKEAHVWEIGSDKKEFVARAINDMRKEVVADRADREQIEAVANTKIDGAKVKDAYTKDGQSYSGTVLAKNARYVLQHTGKEYTTAHRMSELNDEPDVGQSVKVAYEKGRGAVTTKERQKSQGQER